MTEKTDKDASEADLNRINERFNKVDQNVAVLMERTNNLNEGVKQNSSDLMQIGTDIRADMRQESNRNLALYAGGLALYGALVVTFLVKFSI